MENASKALLIAGEILIGMLVLGVLLILRLNLTETTGTYERRASQIEVDKFNSYFHKFGSRTDITPQEVVSAVQYAKEYNGDVTPSIIKVTINGYTPSNAMASNFDSIEFMKDKMRTTNKYKRDAQGKWVIDNSNGKYIMVEYSCLIDESSYDKDTGMITKIIFSQSVT